MVVVRPFAGVRYDPRRVPLRRALCPPYDVIAGPLARRLRADAANAIHLELPPGEGASRYRNAAQTWRRWTADGVLARDPRPCFYVVEQTFRWGGRQRRRLGLLAALGLGAAGPRRVAAHEKTLSKPKRDRLRLLRALRVNTSPVFGLYDDRSGALRRLLAGAARGAADVSGTAVDGVRVRVWLLDHAVRTAAVTRAFLSKTLLIADGHHRFEVAKAYFRTRPRSAAGADGAGGLLVYLCAEQDPGLLVLPTHRVLAAREPAASRVRRQCRLTPMPTLAALERALAGARSSHAFGVRWGSYALAVPRESRGVRSRLGVEWLARRVLRGIDPHLIGYTHEAAEAVARADASGGLALFVKPIAVGEVRRAVETVGLLPQKSTYFHPKIETGIVFKTLG